MNNKVYFLMAIHFHQPIGNFNFVFEKVYNNSYQPFIETIEEFPDIKLTLHFTGCLLEWLQANKPKFLEDIARLVKRGQIEIMTGGFYEPILPVIPYRDGLVQIAMLSDFIRKHFHYEPKGGWVAERVWEPSLPSLLNEAGVKYVVLDDSHLKYSGLSGNELHGYYVTEDNAKTLAVFPSDKKLRYSIPFGQQNQVIDYLKSIANICDGLAAVYGDDAEKFGEWPETYEWVYEKRWLYNFFLALRQNNSWLKTAHMSEYLSQNEPLGRVYMPTASYQEMAEWAHGFWRNFLTKYPEANQMHKKMLRVSEKIKEWDEGRRTKDEGRKLEEARRELYKGQCNCAYWHGVFGGLYLYHLRSAVWNHLIKAEMLADEIIKGPKGWLDCEVGDFDSDGCEEAILSNSSASIFFDNDEGGSITEFDFKPKTVNIVNTLGRRKEPYHTKLLTRSIKKTAEARVKTIHERAFENKALKDKIFYDWYKRGCLLDHFLGLGTTIDNFSQCRYEELGDFINQPFSAKPLKNGIILTRDGQVSTNALRVTKAIELKRDSADLKIAYTIKNTSSKKIELWFGSEFNFSLTNDDTFEQLFTEKELTLKDTIVSLNIKLSFSKPGDIWRFPVKTISQSESDVEENYQSSVVMPHWRFQLGPGERWDVEICIILSAFALRS